MEELDIRIVIVKIRKEAQTRVSMFLFFFLRPRPHPSAGDQFDAQDSGGPVIFVGRSIGIFGLLLACSHGPRKPFLIGSKRRQHAAETPVLR